MYFLIFFSWKLYYILFWRSFYVDSEYICVFHIFIVLPMLWWKMLCWTTETSSDPCKCVQDSLPGLAFFLIFLFEGFATSHFKGNLLKFLNMFRFFIYSLLFLIYNEKCNVKLSKTEVMYATPVARKTISLIFSVEDCTISYFKGLLM